MDNVVSIQRLNYKFVVIPAIHNQTIKGDVEPTKSQICLIGIKHPLRNRVIIHPISGFVLQLKKRSYNTMRNRADTVTRFLNFVLDNNLKYKLKTFSDLSIRHGTDYLDYLVAKNVSALYRNEEENNLTKFYYYLASKDLLTFVTTKDFKWIENKKKRTKYLDTFFPDAETPKKKKIRRPLHNIEVNLLPLFLEIAIKIVPRIALGVYFQVMGGLRKSEVCNCTRTGISISGSYGEFGMSVYLANTFQRDELRNRNATNVKKPRVQSIEVFSDYLPKLYRMHLENYLPTDGTDALFSDSKGRALTSRMYDYYFNKLKKAFIKKLESYGDTRLQAYALTLKTMKWGTHIGRGIFSNIMAEITQDQILTMLKRGDSDPKSSRVYMEDTEYRKNQSKEHLDAMYKKGKEKSIRIVEDNHD